MPPAPIKISQCFWEEYLSSQTSTLPHLNDVEHLSDRVTRVLGGNPGSMQLQGTNTYLVGSGSTKILIDTGQGKPLWIKTLKELLMEKNWTISHVLLTHWHGDHVGGVSDLVRHDPTLAECLYKHKPDSGQLPIEDGQVFTAEGVTLRAVFTPGHAVDHMCFVLEEEEALFTGDNVLGHGNSVAEDLGEYMNSLQVMEDLSCKLGYPAHGKEINNLPLKMRTLIRAKVLREKQIHTALLESKAKRSVTTEELVGKMYGPVSEEAYELAIEPFVTETLWKLTEDRKVCFENLAGCRRWFAIADRTDLGISDVCA